MLQISKQFSFGGKNCRFVVRKGDVPLASMNRDVDRGRHVIIQVDVDPDRTYRVLTGAQIYHRGLGINQVKGEQLLSYHHRLPTLLLFDCRPLRELFEKSLATRHPTVGSIAKYLGRNLFQESGVGAYE